MKRIILSILIGCLLISSASAELVLKKNSAINVMFPMIDKVTPDLFRSAETVTPTCLYLDGTGTWTSFTPAGSIAEIGSTGIYSLPLTNSEMNHDNILCKFSAIHSADTAAAIRTDMWGGPVVLPVMQATAYATTAIQSREVDIIRGDTPRITFNLGKDYSAWTPRFGAKKYVADTAYAISLRTATWTDATKGQGYVDLTATDTATIGTYAAELELVNGDQHLTVMRFTLKIADDVIK